MSSIWSKLVLGSSAISAARMWGSIGTAGLPHVIIRFFTVAKVKDARSSAGWALVFITLLYTTAPTVAAMARLNLHETIQPTSGQNLTNERTSPRGAEDVVESGR